MTCAAHQAAHWRIGCLGSMDLSMSYSRWHFKVLNCPSQVRTDLSMSPLAFDWRVGVGDILAVATSRYSCCSSLALSLLKHILTPSYPGSLNTFVVCATTYGLVLLLGTAIALIHSVSLSYMTRNGLLCAYS